MKKTYTLIGAVIIIIIGVFVFARHGEKKQVAISNQKPTSVKIGYLPVVQSLPLYNAYKKGYFEKENLSVELVKFDAPNLLIDSMISGKIDACVACATGITEIAENKNPGKQKIFMVIGAGSKDNTSNDVLAVKNDSGITSIADLKGKKIGNLPGIQFRTIARHILAQNGLTDKDITLVDIATQLQVQALASKQVDALITLEPVLTILKAQNIGKALITGPMIQYISDPWYGADSAITTKFITGHSDAAKQLISVFAHSVDDIKNNPTGTRQYLVGFTSLNEKLASSVPLPVFKMYNEVDASDINALNKFFDIFVKYGVISTRTDVSKFIYER